MFGKLPCFTDLFAKVKKADHDNQLLSPNKQKTAHNQAAHIERVPPAKKNRDVKHTALRSPHWSFLLHVRRTDPWLFHRTVRQTAHCSSCGFFSSYPQGISRRSCPDFPEVFPMVLDFRLPLFYSVFLFVFSPSSSDTLQRKSSIWKRPQCGHPYDMVRESASLFETRIIHRKLVLFRITFIVTLLRLYRLPDVVDGTVSFCWSVCNSSCAPPSSSCKCVRCLRLQLLRLQPLRSHPFLLVSPDHFIRNTVHFSTDLHRRCIYLLDLPSSVWKHYLQNIPVVLLILFLDLHREELEVLVHALQSTASVTSKEHGSGALPLS